MTRLEPHLRDSGIACRVEVRDRLAILVPENSRDDSRLSAEQRRLILQLAKTEGFTHVAVELDPVGAALPGD
jgi:hypothetical protein